MNPVFLKEPFPHVRINSFYTASELDDVRHELKMLSEIAEPPEKTGGAVNEEGGALKKNMGIFLMGVYTTVQVSPIYRASRKLFDCDFMRKVESIDLVFKYFSGTNQDDLLVQFYGDAHHYKSHRDRAIYSFIVKVDMSTKKHKGGNLLFPDFDYSVDLKNNEGILFPSFLVHEVTPVESRSKRLLDGRITITNFMGMQLRK